MDREPLMQPSVVDMHADNHPPTEFTRQQWAAVRDALHDFGKPFKADQDDPRIAFFRASLAMNLAQQNYRHQLSTVGHQGARLFPERACFAFLGRRPQKKEDGKEESLYDRIQQLGDAGFGALIGDMHTLRKFGNRVDHDDLPDLRPDEKPELVHCVYRIAVAMQLQLVPQPQPRPEPGRWSKAHTQIDITGERGALAVKTGSDGSYRTALTGEVMDAAGDSYAEFTFVSDGSLAVGVVTADYDPSRASAINSKHSYMYKCNSGEHYHQGSVTAWDSGEGQNIGPGKTVGLRLRQGSLCAYVDGMQLGVLCTGLSGQFVWGADMNTNCSVRIGRSGLA